MKEVLLKVLTADMQSPTSSTPIKYELGRLYTCKDFDPDPDNDCSRGFYATSIEGLPYTFKIKEKHRVFEVKVSGKNVNFNKYKRRWSNLELVRELSYDEIRQLACEHRAKCGYNLDEVLFPVDPRCVINDVTKEDWNNFEIFSDKFDNTAWYATWGAAWSAARSAAMDAAYDATWGAAWDAAYDAAWRPAWDAAYDATWGTAWSAAWAYTMSVFPCFVKTTDENVLSVIDACSKLWRRGFLPIVVNGEWKLLSAHNNKILERSEK